MGGTSVAYTLSAHASLKGTRTRYTDTQHPSSSTTATLPCTCDAAEQKVLPCLADDLPAKPSWQSAACFVHCAGNHQQHTHCPYHVASQLPSLAHHVCLLHGLQLGIHVGQHPQQQLNTLQQLRLGHACFPGSDLHVRVNTGQPWALTAGITQSQPTC